MRRILAVDAGFANTGLAVLELDKDRTEVVEIDCITTEKDSTRRKVRASDDLADRSTSLFRGLKLIGDKYDIKAMVVELPSGGGQSATSLRAMGMALAIVACYAESSKLPTLWITPAEVKKATGGNRNASKEVVQAKVLEAYPEVKKFVTPNKKGAMPGWFEHVADAIGAFEAAKNDPLIRIIRDQT